jgi:hypothetical protein
MYTETVRLATVCDTSLVILVSHTVSFCGYNVDRESTTHTHTTGKLVHLAELP